MDVHYTNNYNYLPQKFLAHLHKSYYLSIPFSLSGTGQSFYLKTRFTNNIEHHNTPPWNTGLPLRNFKSEKLKTTFKKKKENRYLRRKSKTLSKSQFSKKFLDLIENNNTIVNISGYQTLKLIYLLE